MTLQSVRRITVLICIVGMLSIVGCKTIPIYNVNNQPIDTGSHTNIGMYEIEVAIHRACNKLGWKMYVEKEGLIVATLNIRSHQAVVDIKYDKNKYSIIYKSSTNLKARNGKIHKNYKGWIMNLDRQIQEELLNS
ncbi:hypothetical protein [Desulfovibrio inopinatus]|uniref:hypothetical protein n=1 Tax=Desulfovibrio inopinatus TaxID=102109 RepID=UPI00041B2047|nr:hypothetical protein [Desulfovibrio inopinatus]